MRRRGRWRGRGGEGAWGGKLISGLNYSAKSANGACQGGLPGAGRSGSGEERFLAAEREAVRGGVWGGKFISG